MFIQRYSYKILKTYLKLVKLNYLFNCSSFLGIYHNQNLNSLNYIILKSTLNSLGLQLSYCNNILFKKRLYLRNNLTLNSNKLFLGNFLVVYSKYSLSSFNKDGLSYLISNKTILLPLFFYFSSRLFYLTNCINSFSKPKNNIFLDLIFVLQFNNCKMSFYTNTFKKDLLYLL